VAQLEPEGIHQIFDEHQEVSPARPVGEAVTRVAHAKVVSTDRLASASA